MNQSVKAALTTLGFSTSTHRDHPPKMKLITKRYYELSLKHHPDRPGGGDSDFFKNVTSAYRLLGEFIDKNYDYKEDDMEEVVARSYFKQSGQDIKKNTKSFTVFIDNTLSHCWDDILTRHYGKPLDRDHNGKHWKHFSYSDNKVTQCDISIGKWHIPKKDNQTKMNVQSNAKDNFLLTHFVSFQLPALLAEVEALSGEGSGHGLQLSHVKSLKEQEQIKCDLCYFKAENIFQN